jgi:hypothetical protein
MTTRKQWANQMRDTCINGRGSPSLAITVKFNIANQNSSHKCLWSAKLRENYFRIADQPAGTMDWVMSRFNE